MQITKHSVVTIHYTLRNPQGETLDSSEGRDPLVYMHGVGGLIPGMESSLEGRSAGDNFEVEIAPEQGYGVKDDSMVQAVPRNLFQGVEKIEPGMRFAAQTPDGPRPVVVVSVDDETVTIDANHPLAGVALHFAVEVVDVREATDEEKSQGHVHTGDCEEGDACCGGEGDGGCGCGGEH